MAESLSGVVDGDGVVALLSADALQLLDALPVLDDLRVVSGKILTLVNDPLGFVSSLINEESSVERRHEALMDENEDSNANKGHQAHGFLVSVAHLVVLSAVHRAVFRLLHIHAKFFGSEELRFITEALESSRGFLLGRLDTKTGQSLTDVVNPRGKPNVLIFIHAIAVHESGGNLDKIVSSMARRMSLLTHEDKRCGSAPGAFWVSAALGSISLLVSIHLSSMLSNKGVGLVANRLITVDLHVKDTGEFITKLLVGLIDVVRGDLGALESLRWHFFSAPVRSALGGDDRGSTTLLSLIDLAPRALIDTTARGIVSLGSADILIGSTET